MADVEDVNGDGLDDILVGASFADPGGRSNAGVSYLVFGTVEGTQASLNLATLNGTNGYKINGIVAGNEAGLSLSGAGDVNGDGYADLLISTPRPTSHGTNTGASYLVFGGPTNLGALDTAGGGLADGEIELAALNGTNGFAFSGAAAQDRTGWSVDGAGT